MTRTIIIGDIHGCVDELTDLLSVDKGISLTKEDTLILVGDLLDKGPDSNGVIRLLSSLRSSGFNITLVLGNHEEKHARFRKAFAKSGKAQGDMRTITEALSDQDIAFLDSAVPYHRIPEHNALVVHGGILPGLETLPTPEDLAAMSKGQVQKFYRILRTRYVRGKTTTKITVEFNLDFVPVWETGAEINAENIGRAPGTIIKRKVYPKGDFLSLGQNGPEDPYWAEIYDGRFGYVYFGHEPFHEEEAPKRFPHATGLDLGCVYGGKLAAVILEQNQPERFVTINAQKQYADKLNDGE